MALIALLAARAATASGPAGAPVDFGGQPLVEYQARLAIAAGAARILIHVDAVTPALSRIVDRIARDDGVPATLVQDMTGLARAVAPHDRVLLVAEPLVPPAEAIPALLDAGPVALLTLAPVPATAAFERIDAEAMWAGALCLPGADLLATLDMLGDWDLPLTLLRRAVQQGARRVALSPELVMDGRLALVTDQASADAALAALSDRSHAAANAGTAGIGGLLAPLSGPLVRELVRRQIEPGRLLTIALALGVASLALGVAGWPVIALAVMLLALGTADLARQSARVTLRPARAPWLDRLVEGGALLLLAVLGWRIAGGQAVALAGAWLPPLLVGLVAVADERAAPTGLWPRWVRLTVPAATLVVLVGAMLGAPGAAFALLGLLSAAAVAVRLPGLSGARV